MDYLTEYLPSNSAVALAIAIVIFIVSASYAAKKLLSIAFTLIMLGLAIASGMAISNNDLVREYFGHRAAEKSVEPAQTAPTSAPARDEALDQIREELAKILNQLAGLLEGQKSAPAPQPSESK